jgi:uncharacterized protein YbjT (DUF2867 family)
MDVAVPGGTGRLGRRVVEELIARGHDVRVISRRAPQPALAGSTHHPVDLVTGVGLDDALSGVDVVIDATNVRGGGRTACPMSVIGTGRLLDGEARAGVAHHVAISIVGIDDVPLSYYRAKRVQEELVERGRVGWSLLRATQFHELLDWLFEATARVGIVPAPRFPVAPVDARVVARVLAGAAEAGPGGRLASVGGPRADPLGALARDWVRARRRRVLALAPPLPRAARRALLRGALVPTAGAIRGGPSFAAWLRAASEATVVA